MKNFLAILLLSLSNLASAKVENVLFIISDDLKASVLGCYGSDTGKTPNVDRLAARGMVFDRAYCQEVWCLPSRASLMHGRYEGRNGVNLGDQLRRHKTFTARVGKIYHMDVPGDIIAGTDGKDVPSSWDEKYNASGPESDTPGAYALLNRNIFTTKIPGRQGTGAPERMFVTVEAEGDGSDQPDWKAASYTNDLLKKRKDSPFFIATGFIRPHYPSVAPVSYFAEYPYEEMEIPGISGKQCC